MCLRVSAAEAAGMNRNRNRIAIIGGAFGFLAPGDRPAIANPCSADQQCRLVINPDPVDLTIPAGTSSSVDATVTNHSGGPLSSWSFALTGGFTFDAPCMPGLSS